MTLSQASDAGNKFWKQTGYGIPSPAANTQNLLVLHCSLDRYKHNFCLFLPCPVVVANNPCIPLVLGQLDTVNVSFIG